MTDRHTADTITDDALDALYERLRKAEDALARVRALAETWRYVSDRKHGPLRELRQALACPHGCDTTHCPCLACEDDQTVPAGTEATD